VKANVVEPYYQSELGKLYHGDCLEIMQSFTENHIDLTITSPPYDNLRSYKGVADEWSFGKFQLIAQELYRVTKNGGVVIWVVGDATINGSETGASFKQALHFMECGFNLHDTMIYAANKIPLTHKRYEQAFEYMFVLSKGKLETFNPITQNSIGAGQRRHKDKTSRQDGDELSRRWKVAPIKQAKIKNNIWFYTTGLYNSTKDKDAFQHPAIFPEKLAADHIISWSNPGDLIFDPFSGSGTTAKQAEILKRRWIACDKVEQYCEIAAKRIEEAANQMSF